MSGLGVLSDLRPSKRFESDAIVPSRPGGEGYASLATSGRKASSVDAADAIRTAAEVIRDTAKREAAERATSTTVAALAQLHAALDERDQAVKAARQAMEMASKDLRANGSLKDPVSFRLAAEVLLRFGETEYAYDTLVAAPRTRTLRMFLAVLAFQAGDVAGALQEMDELDDPLADAVKGYFFATTGEDHKAVEHLRSALRAQPDDPDSLLNLSISLWRLGSCRKARNMALRATRVAPGRKDVSLHYFGILLDLGEVEAVDAEIRMLKSSGVVADSDLLIVQARSLIAQGKTSRAISTLSAAADLALEEGNLSNRSEVLANLVTLKFENGRIDRRKAIRELEVLLSDYPGNDSVVVSYARFANSASQAPLLRQSFEAVRSTTTQLRSAYLRHQIALLEGDNEEAALAASDWFAEEPDNPLAAAAALVALGIGMERWEEAVVIAHDALERLGPRPSLVNNAAYVLAMSGRAPEAIELLSPIAGDDFVMSATLGLARLANGELEAGMRLYREAADRAEMVDPILRSLMTGYQALVVRQLGILESYSEELMSALTLVPFDPPGDWRDRPDFLRLWEVAKRNGYPWPLAL